MRERINRLAKGIVDGDMPVLCMLPEKIEEPVQAGELTVKELYIADAEGRFVKGLIYSSNNRVRIRNQAFGGNRNHITYEVDSTYLNRDDVIAGAFYLVTNGGERKIPFSFSIELGVSGRILEGLKTAEDFAQIARKDQDMALRLFEYQDFVMAPFMQELSVRTLYDSLRGRANRQNLLEEFLLALKVKEPVKLTTDLKTRQYSGVKRLSKDYLEITASTWGYVQFDVTADGDFLELPKTSYNSDAFQERSCRIPFFVNPGRLHRGRNLGKLTVSTVRETFHVDVEVMAGEEELAVRRHENQSQRSRYLELRLEYELGMYEKSLMLNQMKQAVEEMRIQEGENRFNTILLSEIYLAEGEKERAEACLEGIRREVMDQRLDERSWYCYYQYLQYQITGRQTYKDALVRLIQKLLYEEQGDVFLYLLLLKLEPEEENSAEVLEKLENFFEQGSSSPFLYAAGLSIYQKKPQLLKELAGFGLQVLVFAAKHELLGRELAERAVSLAGFVKHYRKLICRLFIGLYEKYPEKEFLSAVCTMLIKGDLRDSEYFVWYEKALKEGISLTRLYEYFLYALPKDYPYLLPREVLLYFSYETWIDDRSRLVLYENILKYMNSDTPLYRQYEREMEQFTMEQLLKARINSRLVVLYERMLYREMIDERVAKVLPSILKSYRVVLKNPNMKYVIVAYEELEEEIAFPLQDGVAYVPLFLEHSVLLFQDAYGNRYADLPYQKLPVMDAGKENLMALEKQCYEVCPDHPMLRIRECGEIVKKGIENDSQLLMLRRAQSELKLRPLYKKRMITQMIAYYIDHMDLEDPGAVRDADFLMDLDLDRLERKERAGVLETLILQEYDREAYELICRYGFEGVRGKRLLKLCVKMILNQLFDEDDTLLSISCNLFSEGLYDSVLLDYLCEHFNGSTKLMYKILSCAKREHVEVYDLPERLLAQMMFTGETGYLDQVFDWYMEGRPESDMIIRAYFTMKSADYFLKERQTGDRVFAYLENAVQGIEDKGRIPTIYLLALTKYYSEQKVLDEERKELASVMVSFLISEGRYFAYYRELGKLITMPDTVMDQVIIEYRGGRQADPELEIRILPEEEDYSRDELKKVYPGIFVRQKMLFDGEVLEYRIYEQSDGERVLAAEGSLAAEVRKTTEAGSRFAALNEMGLCLSLGEEDRLKEKMKKYVTDSAVMEELFPLM